VRNYVNKDNTFEQHSPQARECPHCGAHAQLIPESTPNFSMLVETRPAQVAIGFRCSACGEPRFGRVQVRAFEDSRVELASHIVEIERPKERFQFAYLPRAVARLFREALDCYTADLHNAFASMCRRTAAAAVRELADDQRNRWRASFDDVVMLAELDESTTAVLEAVLFETEPEVPEITAAQSAVLIEVMKDMLYQTHVRTAKLLAAVRMRRYFAEESDPKVTSFRRPRGRDRRMVNNG
jgi:hypothetical protein